MEDHTPPPQQITQKEPNQQDWEIGDTEKIQCYVAKLYSMVLKRFPEIDSDQSLEKILDMVGHGKGKMGHPLAIEAQQSILNILGRYFSLQEIKNIISNNISTLNQEINNILQRKIIS